MQHLIKIFLSNANGYYTKGFIFERLFGLMFKQNLLLCFLIALLPALGFSQVKLSPQLKNNFPFTGGKTLVTLSVWDIDAFRKKYSDKVSIHNSNATAKVITITGLHENLIHELQEDTNV